MVSSENKASIRPVKIGERVGNMWIIKDGVKPGEQVIVEGFQKVKEGTPVTPSRSNPPDKEIAWQTFLSGVRSSQWSSPSSW